MKLRLHLNNTTDTIENVVNIDPLTKQPFDALINKSRENGHPLYLLAVSFFEKAHSAKNYCCYDGIAFYAKASIDPILRDPSTNQAIKQIVYFSVAGPEFKETDGFDCSELAADELQAVVATVDDTILNLPIDTRIRAAGIVANFALTRYIEMQNKEDLVKSGVFIKYAESLQDREGVSDAAVEATRKIKEKVFPYWKFPESSKQND